jgi:hypothetical protein
MSKRIVISESEKNQIKSLYQLNESRKIDYFNGQEFQINIGGGPRTYRINGIYALKDKDSSFIVETTQVKTGFGLDKGVRALALGDKNAGKQFIFDCRIGYLGGYNESQKGYINTENYEDLEINEKFCQYFCYKFPNGPCSKY